MLEPLAASVLTSLFPSRPLAAQVFASNSSFGTAMRSVKQSLASDFFTPHPRSVEGKGKGKALPEDEYGACSSSSDSCRLRSWEAVVDATAAPMTRFTSSRPRARRSPGHKYIASGSRSHIPSLRTWIRQVDVAQRRHASSRTAAELSRHTTPPDEQHIWQKTFKDVAEGADAFSADDAWHAYQCLCDSYGEAPGPASTAVAFMANLTMSVASGHQGEVSPEFLRLWGTRIRNALHHIDPGIQDMPRNLIRVRWNNVLISALAMEGRLDDAIEAARTMFKLTDPMHKAQQRANVVQVFTVIAHAMRQYSGSSAVFDYLVQEAELLSGYFNRPHTAWRNPALMRAATLFRSTSLDILACLEDPVQSLRSHLSLWSKKQLSFAGTLLILAMTGAERAKDAHAVLRLMQKESVPLQDGTLFLVIRDLVREDLFDEASALFAPLPSPTESQFAPYHSTGLYLRSHQGDVAAAEAHYDKLRRRKLAYSNDKNSIMHAYAKAGNPGRVLELFNEFFPSTATRKQDRPNIIHYTTVIYAHAQVGDLDGVNLWLGKLSEAGFRPDLHVYSIVLESFASRGDVTSMSTLLDQMRDSGVAMTAVICTTIISALASRGDPMSAEQLYKRAVQDGVVPDRAMVTAIMNAHAEAGSWDGVIRAWDYLCTPGRAGAAITIEVVNTLMKAYVLVGAPFRTIAHIFRQLPRKNLRPDSRTFVLLIQSACDSGFMDIAEELFEEMDRLVREEKQTSLQADVYVLTVLMSGYLRQGRRLRAKAMLDEMKSRGIEPNAVTYAAILKAYGEQKSENGRMVAQEFLNSLMESGTDDTWLQLIGGRRLTIETVYRPLLNAFVQHEEPEKVEQLYQDMLRSGGSPTLGTLTMLLDVHRRTGNIAAVQAIWPEIYRLGLEFTRQNTLLSPDAAQTPNLRAYGSLMCVPFSILIDALSAAGKHTEIAQTWKTLKDQGLQFDSHNWNHLVAALVRAGEPQRAFDIVENVILRYQRQSRRHLERERDMHPMSPLTLDLPPPEEGDLPPPRPEAPLHAAERRKAVAERWTRRLHNWESLDDRAAEDFAHPLHLLHTMSPLWNTWRPHGATLVLLGRVLTHLRSGRLVQAVQPESDMEFEQMAVDAEEIRRRTQAAGLVLGEIYERFPQTVQLVREYELMRRTSGYTNTAQGRS
ncbi:hypothetical protein OH76DRAFT_1399033 [Lentinus brumalis]|uniref:Pentacotripeptide-repeat region of PRORP domain-containing protein n=1 Tax=Lentinus brumalis TaxID=2498619 RepID=A0A371DMX3_9APHY|nr:hypothetical protein OH76DRAFT_1399033 [Polyporus brumalis]